jgi:hypothetical protein
MLLERLEDRLLFDAAPIQTVDADAELAQQAAAVAVQEAMPLEESVAATAEVSVVAPLDNVLEVIADLTGQSSAGSDWIPEAQTSAFATVDGVATSALSPSANRVVLNSDQLTEQLLTTAEELSSEVRAATASVRDELLGGDSSVAPANSAASPESTNTGLSDAQRKTIEQLVRDSTDQIWFEKNVGQFPSGALYGFRTTFGAMLVYGDHLSLIANQTDVATGEVGQQVVNLQFIGSQGNWSIVPGGASEVLGSYQQADGAVLQPEIFNELTLRNVYDGVDLRL